MPPTDAEIMSAEIRSCLEKLHTGADFVLGVIVGLSIENALEAFLHGLHEYSIIEPLGGGTPRSGMPEPYGKWLELTRVIVFMIMIVRFYFGWIIHSRNTYLTAREFRPGSYLTDYFSALFHFALFFAWSLTLGSHLRIWDLVSPYLIGLAAVLLYTIVWHTLLHARGSARPWSVRNGLTLVDGGLLLLILFLGITVVGLGKPAAAVLAEIMVLIFIWRVSWCDCLELVSGNPPRVKWFVLCGPDISFQ